MSFLFYQFRKWREMLVLGLLVLVIVHMRSEQNFPLNEGYTFPWRDFIVHFVGALFLWELQFWNIRNIYKKSLYERGFSTRLLWRVLGLNLGSSVLFYLCYAPFVTVVIYHKPLSAYALAVGLVLSVAIAFVINGVYLSLELYHFWKEGGAQPGQQQSGQVTVPYTAPLPRAALLLQTGREQLQVPFNQIAYFFSENKIVFAVFTSGKRLATNYTLNELEPMLPPGDFFKVSRQAITSRQAVQSVKKDTNFKLLVTLQSTGQPIRTETVSRYKAAEFKAWFNPTGM